MKNNIHKGSELSNISETWNQNEQARQRGDAAAPDETTSGVSSDLEKVIKEEAADYDSANKEDRMLGGERASVNDDGETGAGNA